MGKDSKQYAAVSNYGVKICEPVLTADECAVLEWLKYWNWDMKPPNFPWHGQPPLSIITWYSLQTTHQLLTWPQRRKLFIRSYSFYFVFTQLRIIFLWNFENGYGLKRLDLVVICIQIRMWHSLWSYVLELRPSKDNKHAIHWIMP